MSTSLDAIPDLNLQDDSEDEDELDLSQVYVPTKRKKKSWSFQKWMEYGILFFVVFIVLKVPLSGMANKLPRQALMLGMTPIYALLVVLLFWTAKKFVL